MSEVRIKLLPRQKSFLYDDHKFVGYIGGLGGGKTFIGAHWVFNKVLNDGRGLGLIGANSYNQLHEATLSTLFEQLDLMNIPYNYKESKGVLKIHKSRILCRSMDKYNLLRGINLSWFWLDEVRDMKEEAFKVLIGRLRDNRSKIEGRLTTTPRGYNWIYDFFVGEKKTPEFNYHTSASKENYFLPNEYIPTLESCYDKLLLDQESGGLFVNIMSGRIYYAFDREKNCGNFPYDEKLPVYVGMDFNVNPMTAVIFQLDGYNRMIIIDEIFLMTSNTHEICEEIVRREYKGVVTVIPDSTGKALKSSSHGKSDHDIIRDHDFIIPRVSNPFRVDRYNCVNNLLEKRRLLVDNKCKYTIKDFERVAYKDKGTTFPDETDKLLIHISDGAGYGAYHFFGMEARLSSWGNR